MKARIILYSVLLICIALFIFFVGSWTIFTSTKTIKYPGEGIYSGEMKGWLFHGQGIWKSDFGVTYEGRFEKGAYNGFGTITYASGASYTGGFKAGLMHGHGVMTFPDGHTHEGNWDADVFLEGHEDCDHDHN